MVKYFLLSLFLLSYGWVFAQVNDNCSTAIEITNPVNYCSDYAEYNNFRATPSNIPQTICIPNETSAKDVWFKFVAVENFVNIRVTGAEAGNINGTLTSPQFTLYGGDCDNLLEVSCSSDAFNLNYAEVSVGPINPGQTYYLCISAREDVEGTFQLCLNNYSLTFTPKSDCPESRILCDKSAVYISHVTGQGIDEDEVNPNSCIRGEVSSSWFRWTCSKSGSLTMKLTPIKPEDDIDFAVYSLPGGINDCQNKEMLRCEAAGENVGQPPSNWLRCTGPTGMNLTSTDLSEDPGCSPLSDNWVRYLDMVEGQSYALLVNNFSSSGQGYAIEWGGTGEFLGARADFSVLNEPICYEDSLFLVDKSLEPTDKIIDWSWNFGSQSDPSFYIGQDPPAVAYNRAGYKTISLTITSEEGCVNTIRKTVLTLCCIDPLIVKGIADPLEIELGQEIELNAQLENENGNVIYLWTPPNSIIGCLDCPMTTALPIGNTTYYVNVSDQKGCIASDSLEVRVNAIYKLFVPNVFTPNHDGTNDRFTIFTNRAAKSIRKLLVYNRWGACVYEGYNFPANDEQYGWDGYFKGKKCNPAAFAWYAEVEFLDGHLEKKKGSITLID